MNNTEICTDIYDMYIDDTDLIDIQTIVGNIPKLITNNLGCQFEYSDYIGSPTNIMYRLCSKFIQKYNKSIKDNRRKPVQFEFGDKSTLISDDTEDQIKLTKYLLENGIYFAKLDGKNYCILDIKLDPANCVCISKIYFIGYKWKKWKKKFNKFINKYSDLKTFNTPSGIITSKGYSDAVFKGFDKLIMHNKNDILEYIDNWVKHIPEYHKKYDMVPKLSILLYGKPGTGKSTFYKALAKYLKINNVILVDKDYLTSTRRHRGTGVYAIDDIDCIYESRNNKNKNSDDSVLSSLLEFLDNPPIFNYETEDGRRYSIQIVVATTNYYDRLDPAIKRYGRFDLQIEMDYFDESMAQDMCDIYGLRLCNITKKVNDKNFRISPAKLQSMCLANIDLSIKNGLQKVDGLIRIGPHKKY